MMRAVLRATGDADFALSGELSFHTVSQLLNDSAEPFRRLSAFRIDLSGVTRADSAGLSLLVEWMRDAAARNQVVEYRHLPRQMLDIAATCGLDTILPIRAS